MNKSTGQIIAIGGGGFGRNPNDPIIEKYILDQSNVSKPKVAFFPTATAEDTQYILNFYKAFSKLNCTPFDVSLFKKTHNLKSIIERSDVIYIGGGNTKSMLGVFKEWGLDKILIQAYKQGKVLAGVSAGAICWFTQGITDSWAHGLRVMDCMNLLEGCCCPHYDGEKNRRPSVIKFLNQKKISSCLAIEDGAAVHYKNNEIYTAVSFYEGKNAYHVSNKNNKIIEDVIKKKKLY